MLFKFLLFRGREGCWFVVVVAFLVYCLPYSLINPILFLLFMLSINNYCPKNTITNRHIFFFNSQAFSTVPKVHVTVKHGTPNQKQDAMSVWIESVSTSQFEVCLKESRTFDGPHSSLAVVCNKSYFVFLFLKMRLYLILNI